MKNIDMKPSFLYKKAAVDGIISGCYKSGKFSAGSSRRADGNLTVISGKLDLKSEAMLKLMINHREKIRTESGNHQSRENHLLFLSDSEKEVEKNSMCVIHNLTDPITNKPWNNKNDY